MERKVIVPAREVDDLQLQTDASGTIGFGAFFNGRWFRGDWSSQQLELSITFKELFAIVAACATWGVEWLRLRVEFQCDNQAAVECLKTGTSRSPAVMALIRTLYSICVMHNFLVRASYLPGISNTIADALCRTRWMPSGPLLLQVQLQSGLRPWSSQSLSKCKEIQFMIQ